MARALYGVRRLSLHRALSHALPALFAGALAACGPNGAAPKPCGTDQVICGTECVNLFTDTNNCGFCGNACAAPENGGNTACVSGECAPSCSGGGLALCDAAPAADGGLQLSCTDTNIDPNNCGGCGKQCGPNQNCDDGVCTGCPSGMLRCPGGAGMAPICLAILSDNANCGGCGTACGNGTYCDNGACVATGDTNCGNADGGSTSQANLQTDRFNCGACGNVCADSETCTSGRCEACPIAQCSNECTDTSSDPQNCGGCAIACTGAQVCIDGLCGAGVQVEILGPADGGFATAGVAAYQVIKVDSALPISSVVVSGPNFVKLADGGVITSAPAFSQFTQELGATESLWSVTIPAQLSDGGWNGGLTAVAYDQAWSTAPAAQQPAHTGSASATLHYAGFTDGGYVPILSISANGTALTNGSFIPLGAGPVELSAQAPVAANNVGSVTFVMTNGNQSITLGTAQQSGQSEVLQVLPTQMLLGQSTIYAYAYGQDGVQENVGVPIQVIVGTVPPAVDSNGPVLTLDDAGTSSIWWLANNNPGAAIGTILNTSWTQTLAAGLPDAGQNDAGYYEDSLVASLKPSVVYAITTGGAVDRYTCAIGFGCRQPGFVTGVVARTLNLETATSLAITDNNGQLWFSSSGAGGTGTVAAVQAGGALASANSLWSTTSGAIFAVVYNPPPTRVHPDVTTGYQLVAFSPSTGVSMVGSVMSSNPEVQVYPSGEFEWGWLNADGTGTIRAGRFDGTTSNLHLTTALPLDGVQPLAPLLARPGVIIGVATPPLAQPDAGPVQTLYVADTNAGNITLPIDVANSRTGPVVIGFGEGGSNQIGVEGRDGALHTWAVSDDQLKALVVTQDTGTAADGTATTPYTLWLVDLVNSTAAQVYSTTNLLPFSMPSVGCSTGLVSPTVAPHFVHSAAGTVNTVQGGTPSSAIAAVPAIVFDEVLDTPAGNSGNFNTAFPVRLYASKYPQTGAPSPAAAIDRYGLLTLGTNTCFELTTSSAGAGPGPYPETVTVPFEAETAQGGGAFIFIGQGAGSDTTLYTAPLFAASGTTLTSSRVLDSIVDFRTREDTGRLLALRSDGNLYGGMLGPSPTLSLELTGGGGGTPPLGTGGQGTFGFTPDGAHAYLVQQLSPTIGSSTEGSLGNGVLEEVDLTSGKRTDFGQLAYSIGGLELPGFFLDNGATAFGVNASEAATLDFLPDLYFWGAMAAQGTHHFESGFSYPIYQYSYLPSWSLLGNIEVSLDGTEGRAILCVGYAYPQSEENLETCYAFNGGRSPNRPSGASPDGISIANGNTSQTVFVAQDGTLYGGSLFSNQQILTDVFTYPATYSPFGAPYTPDFELYESGPTIAELVPARSPNGLAAAGPVQSYWFKRWGSSNGAHLPQLLATGGNGTRSGRLISDLSLAFVGISAFDGSVAPTLVGMGAHVGPQPLLP